MRAAHGVEVVGNDDRSAPFGGALERVVDNLV